MAGYSTADLCTAHASVKALPPRIRPLFDGISMIGRAVTAKVSSGQNAAIHRALHNAINGDILVVDAEADSSHGVFGDLLATCCLDRGVAGAVIYGSIRDSAEIVQMGFPVFCAGVSPMPADKSELGSVGDVLHLDGVRVRPGDVIAGDDDGVVVVPAESAKDIFDRAEEVVEREAGMRERLDAGETTFDILNL